MHDWCDAGVEKRSHGFGDYCNSNGTTYRGYDRFPMGHDYYSPSECDVCNGEEAVARIVDTGEGVCEECRQELKQAGDRLAKL